MMKRTYLTLAAMTLALTACDNTPSRSTGVNSELAYAVPPNRFGFAQATQTSFGSGPSGEDLARYAALETAAAAAADTAQGMTPGAEPPGVGAPQIAYSYRLGFRVDADNLQELQQRHTSLCESMGDNCRILSLSRSGNEDFGYGRTNLQVAASQAVQFNAQVSASTQGVDAEQISYAISGDDLTDNIIDTRAHLEGRSLLRDRLMEVLRTRQGSVGDLVEAERGVADVNEEIDAATSRLADLENRIAYSTVVIEYDPQMGVNTAGFWSPVKTALNAVGTTFGVTISVIIYIAVALIPITAFLLALRWLWRKSGIRIRRPKEETPKEEIPKDEIRPD